MIKHLTPHGNSLALVIDKPIMELLKIDKKTPLKITTDGTRLFISPVGGHEEEPLLKKAIDKAPAITSKKRVDYKNK